MWETPRFATAAPSAENVSHGDPASDPPTALIALGATFNVAGPVGQRSIAASDFATGLLENVLEESEILTGVSVPSLPSGAGSAYLKFPHPASRYAVVGAAVIVATQGGACSSASVVVGGVETTPTRASSVEAALVGSDLSDGALDAAAAAIASDLTGDPMSDIFASDEYRKAMAEVYLRRALGIAVSRASGYSGAPWIGAGLRRTQNLEQAPVASVPASVDELQAALRNELYVADRALAMSIYLALQLRRPLFLEGEAGVGKTEVAKALSSALGARLIRLQCYEGLDVSQAVYEWNYSRQLLHIRLLEASGGVDRKDAEQELFSEEFLIKRPLLQALEGAGPTVLLIDELDRADEEFEGYLLEMLSDFQITIPEVGAYKADEPPVVVITSNRTREIHDALKRRCLYYWIDYPDLDKEMQIVRSKVPAASQALATQVTSFVQELRATELYKVPGVAETLDWTAALVSLNENKLSPSVIDDTLGVMLKYREDVEMVRGEQTRALLNRALHRGTRRGGRRG